MGADVPADAAAAARLRGQRPGAFVRAARALPAAGGTGEPPNCELHDVGAVLPPAPAPGARRDGAPPRRDDAEGPAAPEAGRLDARRSRPRRVPAGARRWSSAPPARAA